MEGNTLSLNETRFVLENGMTVKGKSLKEHFDSQSSRGYWLYNGTGVATLYI